MTSITVRLSPPQPTLRRHNRITTTYKAPPQSWQGSATLVPAAILAINERLLMATRATLAPTTVLGANLFKLIGPAALAPTATLGFVNSVLLLHMDGSNGSTIFTDATGRHALTANGNAQISTAWSEFGGGSGLFNASTDTVNVSAQTTDFAFGNGDFTIDFWINNQSRFLSGNIFTTGTTATSTFAVGLVNGQIVFTVPGYGTLSGATALSNGQIAHAAVVRASGLVYIFVNGVSDVTPNSAFGSFTFGCDAGYPVVGGSPYSLDEFRVQKGVAAWTSNFTPPTASYTIDIPGVQAALRMVAQAVLAPTSLLGGVNYARSFNGTTDCITTPPFTITPPFTVSCWFYSQQAPAGGNQTIFCANASSTGVQFRLGGQTLQLIQANTALILGSSNTVSGAQVWYHVAGSFDGTNAVVYLDGVPTTGTSSATVSGSSNYLIGCASDPVGNKSQFVEGRSADLAVWNTVLTPTQVAQLKAGKRANTIGANANLIFDEPILGQSPEPDISGNNLNGTLTGTAVVGGPPSLSLYDSGVAAALAIAARVSLTPTTALASNEKMRMAVTVSPALSAATTFGAALTARLAAPATLAPTANLAAASSQRLVVASALAPAAALTADATKLAGALWAGSALLAPNVVFGANAQTFIFLGSGASLARSFNGTSDKITIPGLSSHIYNFTTDGTGKNYSWSGWFNSALLDSNYHAVWTKSDFGTRQWFFGTSAGFHSVTNSFAWFLNQTSSMVLSTTSVLSTNTWYFFAATLDNLGNSNLYVYGPSGPLTIQAWDNISPHPLPGTGVIPDTDTGVNPCLVGSDQSNGFFNQGNVAELASWENIILSSTQIAALAAGQRANTIGANANLLGYLPIVGQSPEPDKSGNGNDGTLTGTTVVAGPPLLQGETVALAPLTALSADLRTFIFDTAEILAPAAALTATTVTLLAVRSALAPAASFVGDARTFIFDSAERLAPSAVLNAAALQTMRAQAAFAAVANLAADLTPITGATLWQGSTLLAPNAVFGADARVYIFDTAELFAPAMTLSSIASQRLSTSVLLAPTANVAVNEDMWMVAQATLAPAAAFSADIRTYIFDSAEALVLATSLSATAQQMLAVRSVLAPAAALTADVRTYIFDLAERLAPAAALSAVALQTMQTQATLAPAAALGADIRTFIFDSEAFAPTTVLSAGARQTMSAPALLAPTTAFGATTLQIMQAQATLAPTVTFGGDLIKSGLWTGLATLVPVTVLAAQAVQRMAAPAALAPSAGLAVAEQQRMIAQAALAPAAAFAGDARTFIFDLAERLAPTATLAVNEDLWMAAQAALAPSLTASAAALQTMQGQTTLSPAVTLTADLVKSAANLWQGTALLVPAAVLTAQVQLRLSAGAVLTPAGALAAQAGIILAGTAALAPTTVLGALAAQRVAGVAALSPAATLSVAALQQMAVQSALAPALTFGGDLTQRGIVPATALLAPVATLAAATTQWHAVITTLLPTTALNVQETQRLITAAALAPATTLAVTELLARNAFARLAPVTTLSVAEMLARNAFASLAPAASLAAVPRQYHAGFAGLTPSAALQSSETQRLTTRAAFAASASLFADLTRPGVAPLTAGFVPAVVLAISTTQRMAAQINFNAAAVVGATATMQQPVTAGLQASTTLATAVTQRLLAQAGLLGSTGLQVSASQQQLAGAVLNPSVVLTAAPGLRIANNTASFAVTTTFNADIHAIPSFFVPLFAVTQLAVTAQLRQAGRANWAVAATLAASAQQNQALQSHLTSEAYLRAQEVQYRIGAATLTSNIVLRPSPLSLIDTQLRAGLESYVWVFANLTLQRVHEVSIPPFIGQRGTAKITGRQGVAALTGSTPGTVKITGRHDASTVTGQRMNGVIRSRGPFTIKEE